LIFLGNDKKQVLDEERKEEESKSNKNRGTRTGTATRRGTGTGTGTGTETGTRGGRRKVSPQGEAAIAMEAIEPYVAMTFMDIFPAKRIKNALKRGYLTKQGQIVRNWKKVRNISLSALPLVLVLTPYSFLLSPSNLHSHRGTASSLQIECFSIIKTRTP
jgi:hypothetical protein